MIQIIGNQIKFSYIVFLYLHNYFYYMETIKSIIGVLILFAVGFTFIEFYLKINKIWKRRSDPQVAASQSLIALFISAFTSLVWLLNYYFTRDWEGVGEYGIFLIESVILMTIGAGLYVRGNRIKGISIWSLVKKALKVEKDEANYLLKTIMKPSNSDVILKILFQLALIDEHFAEEEKKLIKAFAKEWDLNIDSLDNIKADPNQQNRFLKLKETLNNYLSLYPSKEQVSQLKDLMQAIVAADSQQSDDEKRVMSELIPEIEHYIDPDKNIPKFFVIVVPQSEEQEKQAASLSPEAEKVHTAGGIAYAVESYYSKVFAELMCERYRNENLFTIVLELP